MDQKYLKYALIAIAVGVALYLIMKWVSAKKGSNSQETVKDSSDEMASLSPAEASLSPAEKTPCESGTCPAYGQPASACCKSNITAEMASRPYIGMPKPCVDNSLRGSPSVAATEVSPWVKEMFAGAPPVGHPSNPAQVNKVYDDCHTQVLDPSGPVGFGLTSTTQHAAIPASKSQFAQACASCTA